MHKQNSIPLVSCCIRDILQMMENVSHGMETRRCILRTTWFSFSHILDKDLGWLIRPRKATICWWISNYGLLRIAEIYVNILRPKMGEELGMVDITVKIWLANSNRRWTDQEGLGPLQPASFASVNQPRMLNIHLGIFLRPSLLGAIFG